MSKRNIFKMAWSKVNHMKEIGFKGDTSLMFAIALKEVYGVLKGYCVCNHCIDCIHRGVCKKEFLLTSKEKCVSKETEKTYYEVQIDTIDKCNTFVTLCDDEKAARDYCKALTNQNAEYPDRTHAHYNKIENVLFKGSKYVVEKVETDYNPEYFVREIAKREPIFCSTYRLTAKNEFLRLECKILKDKSEVVRKKYFSEIGGLKRMYEKMERGVII